MMKSGSDKDMLTIVSLDSTTFISVIAVIYFRSEPYKVKNEYSQSQHWGSVRPITTSN